MRACAAVRRVRVRIHAAPAALGLPRRATAVGRPAFTRSAVRRTRAAGLARFADAVTARRRPTVTRVDTAIRGRRGTPIVKARLPRAAVGVGRAVANDLTRTDEGSPPRRTHCVPRPG